LNVHLHVIHRQINDIKLGPILRISVLVDFKAMFIKNHQQIIKPEIFQNKIEIKITVKKALNSLFKKMNS